MPQNDQQSGPASVNLAADDQSVCTLAIEAIGLAGTGGSIAVTAAERLIGVVAMDADRPTAAALGPALRQAVGLARDHGGVKMVAAAVGPGSFTGLRIAVTAAKTLAYALSCPVVAVDSMLAIAASVEWDARQPIETVEVLLKAYRGQLIGRRLRLDDLVQGRCHECVAADLMPGGDWLAASDAATNPATAAVGDPAMWSRWGGIDDAQQLVTAGPLAVGVACVAQHLVPTDPMALMPVYLRKSAAEEQAGA